MYANLLKTTESAPTLRADSMSKMLAMFAYLRYLSNQLKNSRFQTTEFCGWNT